MRSTWLSSLLVVFIIVGCGGGGKGPTPPPSPPPNNGNNGQVSATLTANPSRIRSGESTILSVSVSGPGPVTISWRQEPTSPSGRFIKIDDSHTRWESPVVSNITEFKLIAVITFPLGFSISVSTTVTVDPGAGGGNGGNPPPSVTPPSVSLSYPPQDGKVNVVGEGVKLTLIGSVQAGSYPVSRLQVLDSNNSLLQEWVVNEGGFRVDLERFGSMGSKVVKIRVLDTQGNYGETGLTLIHDPQLLDSLAREFLKQYCTTRGDGRLVRYGDLQDGPFAQPVLVYLWEPVKSYQNLVEEAFRFWERYTGIRFQLLDTLPAPDDPRPRCAITADFNSDPGYAATTTRGYINSYKVISGSITLYRGWWNASEGYKITTIAHELGHVLFIQNQGDDGQGHVLDGSIMEPRGPRLLHTYQQLAMKILYSHNPGDSL